MKLVCGIGINENERLAIGSRPYPIWVKILTEVKRSNGRLSVCRKFKNYTYFYDWYEGQMEKYAGQRISRDLLDKNNMTYCPDKCVMLPTEISQFMNRAKKSRSNLPMGVDKSSVGGFVARISISGDRITLRKLKTPEEAFAEYKYAKEMMIKYLAEKYEKELDPRAYNALMSYTVEITD